MRDLNGGLRSLALESSTLGELRAAVAALESLPPETFVTFETHVEIRITQKGSRIKILHADPTKTDGGSSAEDEAVTADVLGDPLSGLLGGGNRADRRAAQKRR